MRSLTALCALTLLGCASDPATPPDAAVADAPLIDATHDGAGPVDVPAIDLGVRDDGPVDVAQTDVPAIDAPVIDAPSDVAADTTAQDVSADDHVDVTLDVRDAPVGDVATDAPVDIPVDAPVDVPVDSGCPTAGQTACDGACVDTRTNTDHCGACGQRCCAGNVCFNGRCAPACASGIIACPVSMPGCTGGACVNVSTDPANCGGCGRRCADGLACNGGRCQPPDFMALDPCASFSDYFSTATTVRFGGSVGSVYSPRCVTVRAGGDVTWEGDFAAHPLAPSTRGTAGNPIPVTAAGTSVTVTFPSAGYFPFYCNVHGTNDGFGMAGVVRVAP